MKEITKSRLIGILCWPTQALIWWWLWTIIIVPVFHAPRLTYWDSLGLMVLLGLIFPVEVFFMLQSIVKKLYHEED